MTHSDSDLASRVARLEDREAIRRVRYEYCYAVDMQDWDALVDLFTADATLDYGGLGTYDGHEGVREFGSEFVEANLEATAHAVHLPILDVDGGEATGQWYVTSPVTYADGSGGFRWGRYDERYRREDGDWKIADLRLRFVYALDYGEDGWSDWETFQQ